MTEPGARKPTKPAAGDGDEVVRREKTSPPAPRGHAPKRAVRDPGLPARQGLYDPPNEQDSCGVGFIADMKNRKSHAIVEQGLAILENLDHRGAVGADPMMGDGCGILVQIPHALLRRGVRASSASRCRRPASTASAICSCRAIRTGAQLVEEIVEQGDRGRGPARCSAGATCRSTIRAISARASRPTEPRAPPDLHRPAAEAHRRRGRVRAQALHRPQGDLRTRVYDARRTRAPRATTRSRLSCAHDRLQGHAARAPGRRLLPRPAATRASRAALALVHQRFSTNTFPTWQLAHPYRMVAHNGEINTVRGNVNWMAARQAIGRFRAVRQRHLEALADLLRGPVRHRLLRQRARVAGRAAATRSPHAMMMLIPEAWAGNPLMDADRARLLRIPRRADGAVGRPGRDRLHRRPPDRRDARPQRPAPGALYRHRRRPRRHGLRDAACCRSRRRRSSRSGACSRARCC